MKSEEIIKEIENINTQALNSSDFYDRIKQSLDEMNWYDWQGIRYFLFEYETNLQTKSKTPDEKLKWEILNTTLQGKLTIEHIYPQKATSNCWKSDFNHLTLNQRRILCNAIGNLLPLSQPKNSSLSNKCFSEKVQSHDSTIGFKYGSYSEIEVSLQDKWTPNAILERSLKLLSFMEKKWGLNFGDRAKKIEFLDLAFVENPIS